jgi:HEPN domain-containing protein
MARRFLEKADHDLITARQTLLLPDGPTDTACFHAQQAVEKALKGWLTYRQVSFPKIHDLVRLLEISLAHFPGLEKRRDSLAELSAYAVEVRYPDDWFEPSREEAVRALSLAEEIVDQIKSAICQSSLNQNQGRDEGS